MILGKHLLRLDNTAWMLTLVDAITDRVVCSYVFTSQQDAELAAEMVIGFSKSPTSTTDKTYLQLLKELNFAVEYLKNRKETALVH